MFKRRRKPAGSNGLTAFIDEGSEIEGRYTFSGTVMLNGRFKGEISSTDTLIIGDKGVINGDIRAGRVLVSGEVVGNILGTERVELKRTAPSSVTSRRRWWSLRRACSSRATAA